VPTTRATSLPRVKVVSAVFPGTFDPITRGHEDLIRRSAAMFGRVVVAVAAGHHKQTMFTLDERLALVRRSTASLRNVEVATLDALMVEFVQAQRAGVVVRGVRNASDFDYEFQLAGMNRERQVGLETIFLMPSTAWQFVSSTRVREIATLGGKVSAWVAPHVLTAIQRKTAGAKPSAAKTRVKRG
jgi:pantetheine-phosphate adenylyltransferase